jgi:hypothetical protein
MDKELLEEINNLIDVLKRKIEDLEDEESDRNAPERIIVDMSSEDEFGLFVACRSGKFMNHTVEYVREDLVNCDYYEAYIEAYIKNQKKLSEIRTAWQYYEEQRVSNKGDISLEHLYNLLDVIKESV